MAGIATCQNCRALDVIFLHEPAPDLFLIRGSFVRHVEYFILRTHVQFRVPMAIQAPLHLERSHLPGERHLVNPAMASRTSHSLVDVDAVIEVDKVRQVMDPGPLYRLARPKAVPNRLERRAVSPYLAMAIHAGPGRWDAGERGCFNRGVTISAVDSVVAHMMLMT